MLFRSANAHMIRDNSKCILCRRCVAVCDQVQGIGVIGVTAGFATDMGPFLRNFPEPCFQCWLSMTLPWVLEEPADEAADDRDDEVKTLDRRTEP